jgi:hypothetical protein
VDLTFDVPRDVSRVRLDVPRDRPYEYPRALKVESWTDDGVVRLLQQGPMLPAVLASLKRGSRAISIEIELPPNTTRRLRLTQTGASRQRWSIAEVVLWER